MPEARKPLPLAIAHATARSPMDIGWRPRIGLVPVRFTLFDAHMPAGFAERVRHHATRSADVLARLGEVVATDVIESDADAARAAEHLAGERLDVIVLAPTMAAPPSFAVRALAGLTAPLVVWNAPSIQALPDGYDQFEATVHSTSVGAVMAANVFVRRGRAFEVVTAGHDDEEGLALLARTVRACAVAGSLAGAVVVRVGDPIPGYLDVEASDADLAALGVREHAVELGDWERRVGAIDTARADALVDGLRQRWSGEPGREARRSGALAVALDDLMDESGAVGGTVNCHGPFFRDSTEVGISACLGVACATEGGRPIACTGDQPTAIALVLARRLAGAALYCECYVPERSTGTVLIAAGGEGDPAWAAPAGTVVLEENDHYPGVNGRGTSVAFGLRRGPATLISLSPTDAGWVVAWATGEVVETRFDGMRGPNGMFRFDRGPGEEALSRWIASGATHHNALAPSRLDVEVPALARALGIREVRV